MPNIIYEYKVVTIPSSAIHEGELNAEAEGGWRLVNTLYEMKQVRLSFFGWSHYYFERRKE